MAIKQQKYLNKEASQAGMALGTNGLAKKAALMLELNQLQNRNIIRLRGFKNNGREKLWRFYFEFAPWGDLCIFKTNYLAWNTYFPEKFLWHVFLGLATAALDLSLGPFRNYNTLRVGAEGEGYMIHFEIKAENIFLGDPVDQDDIDFSNYPTVKMADFGLAQVTGARDPENPSTYRHFGTLAYRPPISYLDRFSWHSDTTYDSGARRPNGSLGTST